MVKLEPGENLIISVRKHWFVVFVQGFFLFLAALVPVTLVFIGLKFFPEQLTGLVRQEGMNYLLLFFYFLCLLGIWVAFFIMWTDYYLDVWHITTKRIIAIDQKGLFRREIIDLRYEKVQDATVEISGVIPTLLNFGDLHIQTAGFRREIILRNAKSPMSAKKIILDLHTKVFEKEKDVGDP